MQEEIKGLVSIIIPAYNAANFIEDTIGSVLHQQYGSWEIIIVNDGSTDNTVEIAKAFKDERIRIISQTNSGVSVARNNGLKLIRGEFICFFDADDIMSPDFLKARVDELNGDAALGFVGGWIEFFPDNKTVQKAAADDPVKEILLFEPAIGTTPSSYVFRTDTLMQNKMVFNPQLNSTADRFFILQLSKVTKGKSLPFEKGRLLYRVSSQSMSHRLSPGLLKDNKEFYQELKDNDLFPEEKRRKMKSMFLFSLALGYSKLRYWWSFIKYSFLSFIIHPVCFFGLVGKSFAKSRQAS